MLQANALAVRRTRVRGCARLCGVDHQILVTLRVMAKKIVVEYIDDLDGTTIADDQVQTVEWSWRGVDYVIDTSATNLDKIENGKILFTTVLTNSTRIGGRRRSPVHTRRTPGPQGAAADAQERALIRDWAREHGYNVGIRGRISADCRGRLPRTSERTLDTALYRCPI